ncbi:MAG TPA: hypothetical protein VGB15_16765 [Longimicrobium sp.]|jgi:hypothetical protein
MATLELQFNCLCLFVPEPDKKVVHVLMPRSNGHAGHAGHEKHVVRMLHKSFKGQENTHGRSLEGWALVLGPENASADTNLTHKGTTPGGALPDLSQITHDVLGARKTVDPALLSVTPGGAVAARITLRSGGVTRMASEASWEIGGKEIALAHQVTWRMSDVDHVLRWEGLDGKPDSDPRPLDTLKSLEPEDDLGYKLRIFHVTEEALPPKGGILAPAVMREHFRAFYPLLGVDQQDASLLPSIKGKHINQVNCGAAQSGSGTGG